MKPQLLKKSLPPARVRYRAMRRKGFNADLARWIIERGGTVAI